jgi:hypothetical protein
LWNLFLGRTWYSPTSFSTFNYSLFNFAQGIAALNPTFYDGGTVCEYEGSACGLCYEVTGPGGTATVEVTDCCAGYPFCISLHHILSLIFTSYPDAVECTEDDVNGCDWYENAKKNSSNITFT